MSAVDTPWLYEKLASWWHLFSPPSHYIDEARDLLPELMAASDAAPRKLLELGAGAGSLAWHFKGSLELTLTDRSPQMLGRLAPGQSIASADAAAAAVFARLAAEYPDTTADRDVSKSDVASRSPAFQIRS